MGGACHVMVREGLGLTQETVARLSAGLGLRVSERTVRRIEAGGDASADDLWEALEGLRERHRGVVDDVVRVAEVTGIVVVHSDLSWATDPRSAEYPARWARVVASEALRRCPEARAVQARPG